MKVIIAQIKKDILCHKIGMILWAIGAVVVLVISVGNVFQNLVSLPDIHWGTLLKGYVLGYALIAGGSLLAVFICLMIVIAVYIPLLVVGIIQEDSLIGTTAFWMTKPLARRELLISKLCLVLLLPSPLLFITGGAQNFGGNFSFYVWMVAVALMASLTSGTGAAIGIGFAILLLGKFLGGLGMSIWKGCGGEKLSIVHELSTLAMGSIGCLHLSIEEFRHLLYLFGFLAILTYYYHTLKKNEAIILTVGLVALVDILGKVLIS